MIPNLVTIPFSPVTYPITPFCDTSFHPHLCIDRGKTHGNVSHYDLLWNKTFSTVPYVSLFIPQYLVESSPSHLTESAWHPLMTRTWPQMDVSSLSCSFYRRAFTLLSISTNNMQQSQGHLILCQPCRAQTPLGVSHSLSLHTQLKQACLKPLKKKLAQLGKIVRDDLCLS